MFSYKKTIASLAVAGWLLGAAALPAQTATAELKTPEAAATAKPAEPPAAADTTTRTVAPPEYIVGEADVLRVNVWKEPEVSQTVVVRTDGNISLPFINDVKVSGMTPLQIQNTVAEKLKGFLNNPQVTVTVTEIRSKRAFITGEVARPGTYSLNAETSVLQLIAQAGGFDLPTGPGYGNGSGGSRGARGVVASTGFGSGVATGVERSTTPAGVVRKTAAMLQ